MIEKDTIIKLAPFSCTFLYNFMWYIDFITLTSIYLSISLKRYYNCTTSAMKRATCKVKLNLARKSILQQPPNLNLLRPAPACFIEIWHGNCNSVFISTSASIVHSLTPPSPCRRPRKLHLSPFWKVTIQSSYSLCTPLFTDTGRHSKVLRSWPG
jgi:hypothetical protein